MRLSATEFRALAVKAARGAGIPPAQAEDFGRTALCHLAQGRAADDLSSALQYGDKGPLVSLPMTLMQAFETVLGASGQVTLDSDAPLDLTLSYLESQTFQIETMQADVALHVTFDRRLPNKIKPPARICLPKSLLDLLTAHAARTYVPDSLASRAAGAGAGLTDND